MADKIPPDERKKIINTFEGGEYNDVAPAKLNNKVYTYSLNGRVVFNANGTLSWQTGNGTKAVLTIKFNYGKDTNYNLIGGCEINNMLILFFTQNTVTTPKPYSGYSEIGIVTQPQDGNYTYQTVFNDQYDPNGQLLRLNTRYQIKANGILENAQTVTSYWNDDNNEPRQFNVVAGLTANNPEFINGNYQPLTSTGKYPPFYSVHSINRMCDIQWGLIKYQNNIAGNKMSGKWQYFYRLTTKNNPRYASPWSPGSGLIFLTADQINEDATHYQMSPSGLPTNKGIQIEIKYIDTRYYYIEVAFAYYATETGPPTNSWIFFQGKITGSSMIIQDTQNTGVVPIDSPALLAQIFTDITHAKTQTVNENYLHNDNVVLRGNLEIDTSKVTIQPLLRKMLSDLATDYNEIAPPTAPPLIVQGVENGDAVDINLFGGWIESYNIGGPNGSGINDYTNYKGTQWETLFKGEFRQGKIPLACVLYTKKGQPCFAQHIGDFTFPSQYGNTYQNETLDANGNVVITTGTSGNVGDFTLTSDRSNDGIDPQITQQILQGTNQIVPKILGKLISGIDLTDILYDENGDLQISGFSIVRADRVPNIVAQGLLLNTMYNSDTGYTHPNIGQGVFLLPLRSTGNNYIGNGGGNIALDHGDNPNHNNPDAFVNNRIGFNYFNLEIPDYLIDQSLITPIDSDATGFDVSNLSFQLVGACQAILPDIASPSPYAGLSEPVILSPANNIDHYYSKNYYTRLQITHADQTVYTVGNTQVENQATPGVPRTEAAQVSFGSVWSIDKLWTGIFSNLNDTDTYKFSNYSVVQDFFQIAESDGAWAHQNEILIRSNKYFNASMYTAWGANATPPIPGLPNTTVNNISYYIVNVITGQSYQLTPSLVASRIYKNIGHFVPINAATIAAAENANSGRAIFNNVEVWGGDCYVDFFGYSRLNPYYFFDGPTTDSHSYAIGLIFPCETIYNHTLRQGVTYPQVATRPGVNENIPPPQSQVFNDGIFMNDADQTDRRLEDFNLNQCLNAVDQVDAYSVKSVYYVEEDDQPLYETVSEVKKSGEIYDSFRYFLVNNVQIADSKLGAITDVESLGMNVFVIQQKGWGRIRFNERVLDTTAQTNLTVGSGQGFQGHDYKDFEYGCQHQFSVLNTGSALYWVDALKGKNIMYNGERVLLSDVYGQHNYFDGITQNYWQIPVGILSDDNENFYDNPCDVGGIAAVFDYNNNSAYWTFTKWKTAVGDVITLNGTPDTIEFNQDSAQYKGHWQFTPPIYMNLYKNPLSMNGNTLYEHNIGQPGNFYGQFYNSELTFIVNPGASEEFTFDNCKVDLNPGGYANMVSWEGITEDSDQTGVFNQPLVDERPVYRENFIYFPIMEINQEVRLRGKYCEITYTISNNGDLVRVVDNTCYIRKSYP